jgi:hypothetical protein
MLELLLHFELLRVREIVFVEVDGY